MNRHTDGLNPAPTPSMTVKQRIFVALLLLFALVVSYFVVRFVDPAVSSACTLSTPGLHWITAARTMAA